MASITRFGIGGFERPYDSFADKGGGAHPVGRLTRAGLGGYERPYTSFGGKTSGPHPVSHLTRVGLGGFERIYRSFAGKRSASDGAGTLDAGASGVSGAGTSGSASNGALVAGGAGVAVVSLPNVMILTNVSGGTLTNYPLRFGRAFVQGEIVNQPSIKLDGVSVSTQADVLLRWSDGSAKFAVISAVVPSLLNAVPRTISFESLGPNNNVALTQAQMLDAAYDFDAKVSITPYKIYGDAAYGEYTTSFAPGANRLVLRTVSSFGGTVNNAVPQSFTVTSVKAYPGATSPTAKFKAVIYADSGGVPGTLIAVGAEVVGCTADTILVLPVTASFVAGSKYWVGFITDSSVAMHVGSALNAGSSAANTYASGAPATAPAMSVGPSWRLFACSDAEPVSIASARTMLSDGNYQVFCSGPIATTIVLADDIGGSYDLSAYGHKALRPRIVATFWPATHQVEIDCVVENGKTGGTEDVFYNVVYDRGFASPTTFFSQDNVVAHWIGARIIQRTWLGGTPAKEVNFDHNLAYLRQIPLFAYYDPQWTIPEATIVSQYGSGWSSGPKPAATPGYWTIHMQSTGGREDLGVAPAWYVRWLYSGDWRLRQVALAQADLAGYWAFNFLESAPNKRLLRTDTVGSSSGLGRILSVTDRKTLRLGVQSWPTGGGATSASDQISVIGANWRYSFSDWVSVTGNDNGGAHQPDPFSLPFLLTGDPILLLGLQNWAAWTVAIEHPVNRGPVGSGDRGGCIEITNWRSNAWILRTRLLAAELSSDNSPEKAYFADKLVDLLASWEGKLLTSGGAYPTNSVRTYWAGLTQNSAPDFPDTLGLWGWFPGGALTVSPPELQGRPWFTGFMICALGMAHDLGYPVEDTLTKLSTLHRAVINGPEWQNPYAMAAYTLSYWLTHVSSVNWSWYKDMTSLYADSLNQAYTSGLTQSTMIGQLTDLNGGFSILFMAALSFCAWIPDGQTAWDWCKANAYDLANFSTNPQWAILPRTLATSDTASGAGTIADSASTATGTGTSKSQGTGALVAGVSAILGSGDPVISGVGAIASSGSSIVGVGVSSAVGSGALVASGAAVTAVGFSESEGAGTLEATDAAVTGTGVDGAEGSGALLAAASHLLPPFNGITGSSGLGALAAGISTASGSAAGFSAGAGVLLASPVVLVDSGSSSSIGTGILVSEDAEIVGAVVNSSGTGQLAAGAATILGSGIAASIGAGVLNASPSVIVGVHVDHTAVTEFIGSYDLIINLRGSAG